MRKLVVVLLLLIAIALGGYSYIWMQKADELKTWVSDGITKANEAAKADTGETPLIGYEALKTSGWPLNVTVSLVNPKITVPVHKLMGTPGLKDPGLDDSNLETQAPKPAAYKTWVETIEAQGNLSFSTDLFATNVEVRLWPKATIASTIDGVKKAQSVVDMGTPLGCSLSVARKEGSYELFPVKTMFTDETDFFKRFRAFKCDGANATLNDAAGGLLMSFADYDLRFSTDIPGEKLRAFDLSFVMDKFKVSPAFDKLNAEYSQMIRSTISPELAGDAFAPMPLAPLGETSFDIAGRYNGPIDTGAITDPATLATFEVSRFNVKNDLMKMGFALLLKSEPQGDKRSFAITSTSSFDATDQYDAYKQQQVKALLVGNDPLGAMAKEWTGKLTPAEVDQALGDIIPKLKPLSPITSAIDITYMAANDPMRLMTEPGELTIKNIDFLTALYGLKNEGKGTFVMGNPTQGDLKLSCLSCESMVDRLFTYLKLLDSWASRVAPEKKEMIVTDALHAGVKKFLQTISAPGAEPTTWLYHFVMAANAEPTINGKGIMEIMTAFSENVAPHLPATGAMGNEGTMEEPVEQSKEPSIDDATPVQEEGPPDASSDGAPKNAE